MKQFLKALSGVIAFLLVLIFLKNFLTSDQSLVLALFAWMLIWWTNQVVHYAVTALLPIVVLPAAGTTTLREATSQYANPVIFLFLGGFLLALAIEKWEIHRRLALWLLYHFHKNLNSVLIATGLSSYLLSMWISNTATAIMMLPICTALISVIGSHIHLPSSFKENIFLTIAYAANIGGIATLIGTPPNLVFAGFYNEQHSPPITFLQWSSMGLPVSLLLLSILFLYFLSKKSSPLDPNLQEHLKRLYHQLPPVSTAQHRVFYVFIFTVILWFTAPFLPFDYLNDTTIALTGGLMLFLIPSGQDTGKPLLDWSDTRNLSWGILLLFGAGLTMALMVEKTHLTRLLTTFFSQQENSDLLASLGLISASVLLTEFMSNVALTGLMLPVAAALTATDTQLFLYTGMAIAMASSCAFMLPIATPPNAIAFSTGHIAQSSMLRKGLLLNLISIGIFTTLMLISKNFS